MLSSIASLALLTLAFAWTALNKSGIPAFDWYISLLLIGAAFLAFWIRPRRLLSPAFPAWLLWTVRGLFAFMLFQALPLPLSWLHVFSPQRLSLTRATFPVIGESRFAPIALDPAAHILWFLTLLGCAAVFFLVRDLTFRFRNRLFWAAAPLFLVAGLEGLLGLLQVAGGAKEAIGSYNSRDHYCCILEQTLPLAIAFGLDFFFKRAPTPSIWPMFKAIGCWLLATVLVLGTLFSLSRAGWVDTLLSLLCLATLILLPRYRSNGPRLAVFAGLLVLVFALVLLASPEAMLARLLAGLTTDSEGRLYIWRELRPLLAQYPFFGTGLMGFDPAFLQFQAVINEKRIDFAHNDFLQYFIELGLVGYGLLMTSLGAIVWPVVRACASAPRSMRVLLSGCIAGLLALFVHSLADFNLYVPANVFAFAWILGFSSALTSFVGAPLPTVSNKDALSEERVLA